MQNEHIAERLVGIQKVLMGAHQAGGSMSSASKGRERETFVNSFLGEAFPPPFRFGSGDITDTNNNRSGQIDVVVEYPFLPSLPVVGAPSARLYLAEGVAAGIEVKSNIRAQWDEVVSTAKQLHTLERSFGATITLGGSPRKQIPFYAVGYGGWKQMATLQERIDDAPLDGILVIEEGLFCTRDGTVAGPWSLWALIGCLHTAVTTLKGISVNPFIYLPRNLWRR